jgi:hypothetical protein
MLALSVVSITLAGQSAVAAPAAPNPLPPVSVSDTRIGVHDAFLQSEQAWNAGVRWQRLLFYWDAIQPEWNGQSLPNRFANDAIIQNELNRGYKIVGVIGNPPRWATGEGSVPRNLGLAVDDPSNNWARFVRQLATTYAGRIDSWIIWNEPDIRPGQAGSTWQGSEADYWLLLKSGYKAIKAANPKATVAFAGTTFWADAREGRKLFIERVLEHGARDPEAKANGFFFDVVPFHIYSSPYKVYEVANTYREVLKRYGLEKPIWLNETNVVPADDPHSQVPRAGARGSLEEQANFVIQTLALSRAAGIERVQFYKMQDGPIEGGEPYGLIRNDKSLRPAYVALQTAAKYLLASGKVSYKTFDGVAQVVIDGGRRRTTVAWATGPAATPARVPPMGTSATLVDKYGLERPLPLPAESGEYKITLAGATANTASNARDYIIGGDPVIVVEDGVGDPIESADAIFYGLTGFNVEDARLDYYRRRGGLATFGYPISRPFRLLGHDVQLFQRQAIELLPGGKIGTLNLLDDEFLPYTRFNGAVIPLRDEALTKTAPAPGSRDYGPALQRWIVANAPDTWEQLPVGFKRRFDSTVTLATAFPDGKGNPSLLSGLNLELWGVPTSLPARDPANHDFVYQRFQRGVMHYDRATGATQGLLLAAYLRSVLTGEELPADLEAQVRESRLYRQYDRGQPGGLARPAQLPDSDLTQAFEREPPAR